jgi:phospholipid/cholesterol/gamma-HCH transport system permease protein
MVTLLNNLAKEKVFAVQDATRLLASSVKNLFSRPRYPLDVVGQMDVIGVGSLPIVLLAGFFTGAVLALQSYKTLSTFGEVGLMGQVVALSLVRELGPVLTALMVAGRNSSGMASELGSMQVSEQIDAMRALGTDPIRKLVGPRLFATVICLPMLTVLADLLGLCGGYFVSHSVARLGTTQYWSSAYQALSYQDLIQGLSKPLVFGVVIALVGCYFGLTTQGGTEGVGRSTTRAVVFASVLILVLDFFITKLLIGIVFS